MFVNSIDVLGKAKADFLTEVYLSIHAIMEVRDRASLQPTHWDHKPTEEERRAEDTNIEDASIAQDQLKKLVKRLSDRLMCLST